MTDPTYYNEIIALIQTKKFERRCVTLEIRPTLNNSDLTKLLKAIAVYNTTPHPPFVEIEKIGLRFVATECNKSPESLPQSLLDFLSVYRETVRFHNITTEADLIALSLMLDKLTENAKPGSILIENCGSENSSDSWIKHLCAFIASPHAPKEIIVRNSYLKSAGASIGNTIKANRTTKELYLQSSHLQANDCHEIISSLIYNATLMQLRLNAVDIAAAIERPKANIITLNDQHLLTKLINLNHALQYDNDFYSDAEIVDILMQRFDSGIKLRAYDFVALLSHLNIKSAALHTFTHYVIRKETLYAKFFAEAIHLDATKQQNIAKHIQAARVACCLAALYHYAKKGITCDSTVEHGQITSIDPRHIPSADKMLLFRYNFEYYLNKYEQGHEVSSKQLLSEQQIMCPEALTLIAPDLTEQFNTFLRNIFDQNSPRYSETFAQEIATAVHTGEYLSTAPPDIRDKCRLIFYSKKWSPYIASNLVAMQAHRPAQQPSNCDGDTIQSKRQSPHKDPSQPTLSIEIPDSSSSLQNAP